MTDLFSTLADMQRQIEELQRLCNTGSNVAVTAEVPTGTINGSNTSFTLAYTPAAGSIRLYINGVRLKLTTDFTVSGSTITMNVAPVTGDILIADYTTSVNTLGTSNADTVDGFHAAQRNFAGYIPVLDVSAELYVGARSNYSASVYDVVAFSTTNSAWTASTFGAGTELTNDVFSSAMHSTSTNTDRFNIGKSGVYLTTYQARFADNAAGTRGCRLVKNSTVMMESFIPPDSGGRGIANIAMPVKCTAGDYLKIETYQNSGAALNLTIRSMSVTYLGKAI